MARRRRGLGAYLLLLLRLAVGAAGIAAGAQAVRTRDTLVVDLERWGLPSPSALAYAAAAVLVVGGVLVLLGLATRLGALLLLIVTVVAMATAGRIDGNEWLVAPPGLAAVCLLLLVAGGGALELIDRIDP